MSSLIVDVVEVAERKDHPNADRVELLRCRDWWVVSQKGQFNVADKAVFFPPDTVISEELAERFGITNYVSPLPKLPDGTRPPGRRIRAARFRGEQSFGFITKPDDPSWPVGMSVAEYYGVTKFEPVVREPDGDIAPDVPGFHTYTDIENIKNFPDVFADGEEVVITEKIHGCLCSQTKIRMADGSRKKIIDIQAGDMVLGMDSDGQVVETPVVRTFNNGPGDRWLRVETTRERAGRGNPYASVTCTPNHRFWSPERQEYIPANSLKEGDAVLHIRYDMDISEIQRQVLLGKLLGDGSLVAHEASAHVAYGHSCKALVDWTERALGCVSGGSRDTRTSGYGTEVTRTRTKSFWHIHHHFADFIADGKSVIPPWVETALTPLALAFFYMDDGSLSHADEQEDRAALACCNYTQEDCEVLIRGLARLGIEAVYYTSDEENYSRLRINANSAERFFLLVAPYIPPDLQYKLPKRYRGHQGWLPESKSEYKPWLVEQVVRKVVEVPIESSKYDIETGTHNFFAGDLLVHNSNSRIGYIRTDANHVEFMAGSRTTRKKETDAAGKPSLYWKPINDAIRNVLWNATDPKGDGNVIVFGEIYGAKVQDLAYGLQTQAFRAFDIAVDGSYLGYDAQRKLFDTWGVETVPVLYRGPFSKAIVAELTDGPTTLCPPDKAGKFKGREGVVVKPTRERYSEKLPNHGRVILKSISIDYLERKGGSENH